MIAQINETSTVSFDSSNGNKKIKYLWYVDEDYISAWNRILREIPPPNINFEIKARTESAVKTNGEDFPKNGFGFIISRKGPTGESISDVSVIMFSDLSRRRAYQGWNVLALDPWMVFRKREASEPDLSFLDNNNEHGSLLLAGEDKNAVRAWLCQLMQRTPGVFIGNSGLWEEKSRSIERDYPFQVGALNNSWVQIWPMLFVNKKSSIYAPLSHARALPPQRAGLLEATRFPEPKEWGRFGLQADLLWSKQMGSNNYLKEIEDVEKWLLDPKTQTVIANMIEWIPSHPSGVPYNTISWETQMAWLRSSFIWQ
jgi:hypothetical protein